MKTFIHLFHKILRAIWSWLLGTALASALMLIVPVVAPSMVSSEPDSHLGFWYSMLQVPGGILTFLTVAIIIHLDPLAGGAGFILTRPVRRVTVLLEKIALILSLVVLPAAVMRWGMFALLSTGLGLNYQLVLFAEQFLWISCLATIPLLPALWTERMPHYVLALAAAVVFAAIFGLVFDQFDNTPFYSGIRLPLVPAEYGWLPLVPAEFDRANGLDIDFTFACWTMGALLTALAQALTLRKWPVAVLFCATLVLVDIPIAVLRHPAPMAEFPAGSVRLESVSAAIEKDDHSAQRTVRLSYVAAGLSADEILLPVVSSGTLYSTADTKGRHFEADLPKIGTITDYQYYNRRIIAAALKLPPSAAGPAIPEFSPVYAPPSGHEPDPTRLEGNLTFEVVRTHVVVAVPAKPDVTASAEYTHFTFGAISFANKRNTLSVDLGRVFSGSILRPVVWSGYGRPYAIVAYNPGDGVFYFDQRGSMFMRQETLDAFEYATCNTSFDQSNVSAPGQPIPEISATWLAQSQIYVLELEPVGLITLPFHADIPVK